MARSPTKKKPTTAPRRATSTQSNPLADPTRKSLYDAELARYRQARDGEMAGWDLRYESLGAILDGELYLAAGFKSARAFLAAEAPDQDERTVRTNIRVARHFDPDDEAKYGPSRLLALLDYLDAAGGLGERVKIHPERQQVSVPGARRGTTTRVAFADATVAQLRGATRAARAGKGQTGKTASPVEKAVRALLGKTGLGHVTVRVRKDIVDLGGIPVDGLAKLGAALAKAKIDPA